ncbi:solute carrier family 22 member 7 [Pelobates cultripes]|uniref:Solute carrier family 22 member 7 n=1 Tax=Pelobates cultripes TaxID=61616 RepID=A0AAD1RKN7_PELCU|nr:solute carrier family 22 member 7 [Pelobates cultripes]
MDGRSPAVCLTPSSPKKLSFDDLLLEAGGFGRFQVLTLMILCIPRLILPQNFLLHIFISSVPSHHCAIFPNELMGNLTKEDLLLVYIPREVDGAYSSCKMYSQPQLHLLHNNSEVTANKSSLKSCDQGWEYDHSTFISTTATQWDLICERKWLNSALATFFFIGVTMGAICIGYLSDRYGRRTMLLICYILSFVFGSLSAVSISYTMLAVCRTLCGMSLAGLSITTVALSVEWVDMRHRTFAEIITGMFWSVGSVSLALMAYLLRDWHWLLGAVTAPCLLGIISIWWLPESARWLLANGKVEKAEAELARCAVVNGQIYEKSSMNKRIQTLLEHRPPSGSPSYIDLFRTPALRKLSLCLALIWFGVASSYYGISLNITGFGLSMYLTHCLYGLIEFPAKLGIYVLMNWLGRRWTQVLVLMGTAVCIGANMIIPMAFGSLRSAVAIIGKGFSEASFTSIILYTAEIYPTIIRQNGIGYASFVGRLGVSVAPMIMLLEDVWLILPQTLFCCLAVTGGLVANLLPETQNVQLPETISDVESKRSQLHDEIQMTEK